MPKYEKGGLFFFQKGRKWCLGLLFFIAEVFVQELVDAFNFETGLDFPKGVDLEVQPFQFFVHLSVRPFFVF